VAGSRKKRKYNPNKRYKNVAKAILRSNHFATIFVSSGKGLTYMIDRKTGIGIKPVPQLIKVVTELQFKWSVLMAALCIGDDGKEYMKYEEIIANDEVKQSELADFLNESHKKLIEGCNPRHVVNAAWIASPVGHEWTEAEAARLFSSRGGWDVTECSEQ